MAGRITIDLNVRVEGNRTFVGLDDVVGPISQGEGVEVIEPESGVRGTARVARIDTERGLVYLDVDWSRLHAQDAPAAGVITGHVAGWKFYPSGARRHLAPAHSADHVVKAVVQTTSAQGHVLVKGKSTDWFYSNTGTAAHDSGARTPA